MADYRGINQNREFSRVHLNTPITITAALPLNGDPQKNLVLHGQTIDMTASGILVSFLEEPPTIEQVNLEICLPTDPPERIRIPARPIRKLQAEDNQWKIAYRFDTISGEDRDKIIGCCLVEQRRMLRLDHGIRGSE